MKGFLKLTAKHTVVFGVGDIAQKALSFFLLPVYMRCLTPDDYGVLAILGIISMVFGGPILQGLPTATFRAYSFDYAKDADEQKDTIYTAYTYLLLFSFVVYFLLFLSAPVWTKVFFKDGDFTRFIRIVFITGFFGCASNIPFVVLRARLLSAWAAGISLGRAFANTTLVIWLVVFRGMGVEGVLVGNLIISALIFLASPLIPIIIHRGFSLHISLYKLKNMLAFGLPMVPGIFAAWIMSSADRYFLEHFSTRADLGLYSVGFSFASIVSFAFVAPFRKVWPAIFYPKAQESDAKEVFSRFATYFLLVGALATVGIICASRPLIMLMGPKEYWNAHIVVPILALGLLLHGFQATINIGLFVQNKTRYAPLIVIASAASNILFNALLVPRFGMIGAASATLLAFIVMLAITIKLNNIIYPVTYEYRRIVHLSILFLVVAGLSYTIHVQSLLFIVPINLSFLFMFVSLLFLTRFFNTYELSVIKGYYSRIRLKGYKFQNSKDDI